MEVPDITEISPPAQLHKYVAQESLRAILQNGTLKWSSPLSFNDPFDMQWAPSWEMRTEKSKEAFRHYGMEAGKSDSDITHLAAERQDAIRKLRAQWKADPQEAERGLLRLADRLGESVSETLSKQTREKLAHLRMLCLSQKPSSILMWSHYAENHKGAVLEFDGPKLADCHDCRCVEVEYVKTFPAVIDLDKLAKDLFSGTPVEQPKRFMDKLVRCKWEDWRYEQEIRLLQKRGDTTSGLFSFLRFKPDALRFIKFGCNAEQTFVEEMRRLAAARFPNVRFQRGKLCPVDFAVEFEDC